MTVGSGICSQFGFKAEAAVGTAVTVDHFLKHVSVTGDGLNLMTVTDEGLGGCADVPTVDRTVVVGTSASRQAVINAGTKGLGLLLKQMMGSVAVATQIGVTNLYRQIHLNGDISGKSLTCQFSFPEATATGTNRPFTYNGVKITDWELAQDRNELLTLNVTLDAWGEAVGTALATASYPAASSAITTNEPFRFSNFYAKIGGTPSVTSGLTSVASGVAVAGLRGVSIKGANNLRTDAFYGGGAGVKSEQLQDGFKGYTADLSADFASQTQLYDIFAAYTTVAIEFGWIGLVDVGAGSFGKLSVILPQAKLTKASPAVSGPGVVDGPVSIMAFSDPAGVLPACQVLYESSDTVL